jgi:hypothetical protein
MNGYLQTVAADLVEADLVAREDLFSGYYLLLEITVHCHERTRGD